MYYSTFEYVMGRFVLLPLKGLAMTREEVADIFIYYSLLSGWLTVRHSHYTAQIYVGE